MSRPRAPKSKVSPGQEEQLFKDRSAIWMLQYDGFHYADSQQGQLQKSSESLTLEYLSVRRVNEWRNIKVISIFYLTLKPLVTQEKQWKEAVTKNLKAFTKYHISLGQTKA